MSLINKETGVPVRSKLEQYQQKKELQKTIIQQQMEIDKLSTLVTNLNEENKQQDLLISKN